MAQDNSLESPDLQSLPMDLESSNSSLDLENQNLDHANHPSQHNENSINDSTQFLVQSPQSNYPCIRKPPPPPTSKAKKPAPPPPPRPFANDHNSNNNDSNLTETEETKQNLLKKTKSSSIGSSAHNLLSSAKSSISRGAKSVSTKTYQRISLAGQLKQARISLQKFVNPTMISSDKAIPKWVLKKAKGIVFLSVIKAGFLLAGSAGLDVLLLNVKMDYGVVHQVLVLLELQLDFLLVLQKLIIL